MSRMLCPRNPVLHLAHARRTRTGLRCRHRQLIGGRVGLNRGVWTRIHSELQRGGKGPDVGVPLATEAIPADTSRVTLLKGR